jgi:hypothetical protein
MHLSAKLQITIVEIERRDADVARRSVAQNKLILDLECVESGGVPECLNFQVVLRGLGYIGVHARISYYHTPAAEFLGKPARV